MHHSNIKILATETHKFKACLFIFFYEKILRAQKALKRKTTNFHPLRSFCARTIYMPRTKKLAQRNIFYFAVVGFKAEPFSLHLTKHVKLNSLSHDIYLRVIWI